MELITPDFGYFFWMVLAFGIVFFFVAKFAFPIIGKTLKNREQKISEALEQAERTHEEMKNLQAKNEEIEKEKLEGEAEEFVSANADVIPEEMTEEIKNEFVEDKEKAEVTVANFRKVHDRAVLNAAKAAQNAKPKQEPVKKAINWREAKKPVALNFEAALAEAGGDPEKENEIIKNMCAKH